MAVAVRPRSPLTSIVSTVRGALSTVGRRSDPVLSFQDWVNYFTFSGNGYASGYGSQTLGQKQEVPSQSFEGYVQGIYKANGIVFACMVARMQLFSEARFQFRRFEKGRPGELFGTPALQPLETPWANGTTGDLLARGIQDADIAGNHFAVRRGDRIYRLRPDWTVIAVGSRSDPDNPEWAVDSEIIGFGYYRGGYAQGKKVEILLPNEVAHFAPTPDPAFRFRGMSWLQPVINEVLGDQAATTHKLKFFENGATPNLLVSLDKSITVEAYNAFIAKMKEQHEGVLNAYRTLYMGGGSTATVVGANMRQIDFKVTQGAGETRIAAAARIPPIVVGLSEGLSAATYSNYGQARRAFADGTMRPLWRNIAGSYASLIDVPNGSQLWYDDRDISFLQEDVKDAADIQNKQASTIQVLISAGYKPDTVVAAVISGDFDRLEHTGLYSVQLQPPQPDGPPKPAPIVAPAPPPALPPGPPVVPPPPAKREVTVVEEDDELTPRERQIRDRLARDMTNKQIADELGIAVRTVESHVNSVLRKIGVTSRTEVTSVTVQLPERMVEVPITMQPASIDVHVDAPDLTPLANLARTTPPNVELHITAPPVTLEKGAVEVNVEREQPQAPTELHLHVEPGAIQGTTNIQPGAVKVDVKVDAGAADMNVVRDGNGDVIGVRKV